MTDTKWRVSIWSQGVFSNPYLVWSDHHFTWTQKLLTHMHFFCLQLRYTVLKKLAQSMISIMVTPIPVQYLKKKSQFLGSSVCQLHRILPIYLNNKLYDLLTTTATVSTGDQLFWLAIANLHFFQAVTADGYGWLGDLSEKKRNIITHPSNS